MKKKLEFSVRTNHQKWHMYYCDILYISIPASQSPTKIGIAANERNNPRWMGNDQEIEINFRISRICVGRLDDFCNKIAEWLASRNHTKLQSTECET